MGGVEWLPVAAGHQLTWVQRFYFLLILEFQKTVKIVQFFRMFMKNYFIYFTGVSVHNHFNLNGIVSRDWGKGLLMVLLDGYEVQSISVQHLFLI
jgi:hypothetical protein